MAWCIRGSFSHLMPVGQYFGFGTWETKHAAGWWLRPVDVLFRFIGPILEGAKKGKAGPPISSILDPLGAVFPKM